MNLHRSNRTPDWAPISPSQRSLWQQLAAKTAGWVTPGNIITVIGFGLVILGLLLILRQSYWSGLIALVIGRSFDLLDGIIADATATKSPLGEAFDATFDKLGTAATLAVLIISKSAPWWAIVLLVLPQLYISLLALHRARQGRRFHPSQLGKVSLALAWVGLVGLILIQAAAPGIRLPLAILVYSILASSLIMNFVAAIGYSTVKSDAL